MHDAGCLGLMHWDDPVGWYGVGGGRGVQDGEHMYTCGFIACGLLDRSHSDWREMVPHCGFDLHFSDNE